MRGIQLLRVLFALMFMALPSLQAKVDEAVPTPASAGAVTVRIEQITGTGGTFPARSTPSGPIQRVPRLAST